MTSISRNCPASQMGLFLYNKHLSQLRKKPTFDRLQLNGLPISVQACFTSEAGNGLFPLLTPKEITALAAFKPCTHLHTDYSAGHVFDAFVNS